MHVRAREEGDIDACVAMAERVHLRDGYPPRLPGDLRAFVASPDALAAWVVVEAGQVVGQIVLNPSTSREAMEAARSIVGDEPVAVVARLLVDPERRRRGVGRRLVEVARDAAWTLGRRPILDVAAHFHAAISLYERSGWTRVAEVEAHIGDTEPLREYLYLGPGATDTT